MSEYLTLYMNLFPGRKDCYGTTRLNGKGLAVKEPLTDTVFSEHLAGKKRLGVYPLVGGKCKFSLFDLDQDNFQSALSIVKRLAHYNFPAYIEKSKAKGYHVWLFFSDWVLACKIRSVLKLILRELELDAEIFPKQASANNGFGNYIYLPFFNLENNNGRTVFVDEHGSAYPDQVAFLKQIQQVSEGMLNEIVELNGLHGYGSNSGPASPPNSDGRYDYVREPMSAILKHCAYLDKRFWKAKEEGHLEHEERIHFSNVFLLLPGGREWVIDLFSCLSDFDIKTTEYQLNSLRGNPTLCITMCEARCEAIKIRGGKSPIIFAYREKNKATGGGIDWDSMAKGATEDKDEREEEEAGRKTEKASKEKGESRLEEIPSFPERGYIGIANTFADLHAENSESPKVFYYFSFLTYLGTIFSPYIRTGNLLEEEPRLYCALLGPSATARKSTAISLTSRFFKFLERTKDNADAYFSVLYGAGSGEGIAEIIRKNRLSTLLNFDELKGFVDKAKQPYSVILPLVTTLFSQNDWANYTKDKPIRIENAHMSLIAACTEDTFKEMWTGEFLHIGFINRLFLVLAESNKKIANPPPIPQEHLEGLKKEVMERLNHISACAKARGVVRWRLSDQGDRIWADWYNELTTRSIYAKRLDTFGMRIMLLLHLSSDSYKEEVITDEIVSITLEILNWQYEIRRLTDPIDAETLQAKIEEKIRRALKAGPLTYRKLQKKVHGERCGVWIFKGALKNLKEDKQVYLCEEDKKYYLEEEND